jgi:hypothetical protein
VLVPDAKSVYADVAFLHEGHGQTDQAGPLLGHVDAVGGEDGLAIQSKLVLGVGESGHEGGEPGTHAPEDQLVTDLLEEFC